MERNIPRRRLTDEEQRLVSWLVEQSGDRAERLRGQVPRLEVVSGCECGCGSINFAMVGQEPQFHRNASLIVDFVGPVRDYSVGVMLWEASGQLIGLEFVVYGGDRLDEFPRIETLESVRGGVESASGAAVPVVGRMNFEIAIEPFGPANMDRAAAFQLDSGAVLVLADGVGGIGGGGQAAGRVIGFVQERARDLVASASGHVVASMLREADQVLWSAPDCGETTAVVAVIVDGRVLGASVGDSEAWMVGPGGRAIVLTEHQQRRPFIGAGAAEPVPFGPMAIADFRLVLGSDGLFKYVSRKRILDLASTEGGPDGIALALARAPQLASGQYPDDTSVIVCSNA